MTGRAVIRMHAYTPTILTTEEFETLQREVGAASLVDPTIGTLILSKLLMENEYRYNEACRQNRRPA